MDIVEVVAEGVLGRFDYKISMGGGGDYSPTGRMRVLYAPNGRGKTNMLNALANLLSPSQESLISLCDAPVRLLSVSLADHSTISMEKSDPFDGNYLLQVQEAAADPITAQGEQESVARRPYFRVFRDNPELERASSAIKRLHPGAIWIGADRLNPSSEEDQDVRYARRQMERPVTPRCCGS